MSFRTDILFQMYNEGDLRASNFRNHFPPGTDCFELSLKQMMDNNEIEVVKDGCPMSFEESYDLMEGKYSGSSNNILVKITPNGRNIALGGGIDSTFNGELPF